jgi:hypothetical protein
MNPAKILRFGKYFGRRAVRPSRKFFNKHKYIGGGIMLTAPGIIQTTVSHPFEHAQVGRGGIPKYIKVKDADGSMITVKNPDRYGKIKLPVLKPITYDRGDYTQHYLARLPKGVINSLAIFGTIKGLHRIGVPKL